jgi:BCD family chlorophyll transporter-like MFS transporter
MQQQPDNNLQWGGMLRLALVQTALGAIVVLATSMLNRIMVVELTLPALVPAALVAAHYLVQLQRLHVGYRVDVGGRCTPRIVGGMATLAAGGVGAAIAVALMRVNLTAGMLLAVVAYLAIGVGVGAAGTANLALLTKRLAPQRRPLAAALVWIMMIAGFSISAGVAGHFMRPYSPQRLVQVFAIACTLAFLLAWLAVRRIESGGAQAAAALPASAAAAGLRGDQPRRGDMAPRGEQPGFGAACRQLWSNARARHFTLFLFTAMFAFSAEELLLEPFAGLVFGFPPADSARLAGLQNAGVLLGMLALVAAALVRRRPTTQFARRWMIGGTAGSALAVGALALIAGSGRPGGLTLAAFALGVANGTFAVAALGVMMDLSAAGGRGREGLHMGLWGATQAIAFAAGGLGAGGAVDLSRLLLGAPAAAYSLVLCLDALLFLAACAWALRLGAAASLSLPSSAGPSSAGRELRVIS